MLSRLYTLYYSVSKPRRLRDAFFRFLYALFPKGLEHLCDATLLLFHVGVYIEIERCSDVGMTEQHADSLVVAVALNTASGEAMA